MSTPTDEMEVQQSDVTAVEQQPITPEHNPHIPDINDRFLDPGTARSTLAASNKSPNITFIEQFSVKNAHRTVLTSLVDHPIYRPSDTSR